MKVMVFQWPKGADPFNRLPFGPQPRSGAIFVLARVSSIARQASEAPPRGEKTSREGSMLA